MTSIAVAQMTSTDQVADNLSVIDELASEAVNRKANVLFLPECCALMQTSRAQLRSVAERDQEGPIQSALSATARRHQITLFAGSIPLSSDDPMRVYNSSLVFGPDGGRLARYDKMHLFDVTLDNGEQYHESAYTMAGSEAVNLETPLGNVGLTVCYDLRFPELYRRLVERGAGVLLVPSAFSPTTGPAHWRPLLQARAIENGCYVIAAAQVGEHPSGRKTWGHSLVVDPWGRVIADMEHKTGLLMSEIDHNQVVAARRQMPSLNHRVL